MIINLFGCHATSFVGLHILIQLKQCVMKCNAESNAAIQMEQLLITSNSFNPIKFHLPADWRWSSLFSTVRLVFAHQRRRCVVLQSHWKDHCLNFMNKIIHERGAEMKESEPCSKQPALHPQLQGDTEAMAKTNTLKTLK